MSDLFVSLVALTPKPSSAPTQSPPSTPANQGIGGLHSDLQADKVVTPGQPK